MSNVIRCDFRRTERRKEMTNIELKVADLMKTFYNSLDMEDEDIATIEEINRLDKQYSKLVEEEREWGQEKWWK